MTIKINQKFNMIPLSDNVIGIMLSVMVISIFLTNIAAGLQNITGLSHSIVSMVCKSLVFITLIPCVYLVIKRFNIGVALYILVTILLCGGQLLVFSGNEFYEAKTLPLFLFTIFPVSICFFCVRDYEQIYSKLVRASYMAVICFVLLFLLFEDELYQDSYTMGLANSLIIPLNTLSYKMIYTDNKKSQFIDFVLILLAIIGIIMKGSRGGLVSIICCLLFFLYKKKKKKLICIILITVIVLVIAAPLIKLFLEEIINMLNFIDIKDSRTIWILLNEPFHDSGRRTLWKQVWESFLESPFSVRGINSDYFVIGTYSHTYILELLHSFGAVLGGVAIICFLLGLFKGLRTNIKNKRDVIAAICLFGFFPQCFFSGSIWISTYFWIWLAIMISSRNKFYIEN